MPKKSTKTTSIEDQIANLQKKLAQISDAIATQTAQTVASTQAPPPEPPQTQAPPPELQSPPPQSSQFATVQKSRSEILAGYEQDYLQRLEKEAIERRQLQREAEELAAKREAQSQTNSSQTLSTKGSMPKGWTPS